MRADGLLRPQAKVERDLFGAAAASVQFVGELADPPAQLGENEGVYVLFASAREIVGLLALKFCREQLERLERFPRFRPGEDSGALQRPRVGGGAYNIGMREAIVKTQREGERLECFARALLEA